MQPTKTKCSTLQTILGTHTTSQIEEQNPKKNTSTFRKKMRVIQEIFSIMQVINPVDKSISTHMSLITLSYEVSMIITTGLITVSTKQSSKTSCSITYLV